MSNPTKQAFKDVLDLFVFIGNSKYNGKHEDNAMNIFMDMDAKDQKALLLGVFFIYTIFEHGLNPDAQVPKLKPTPQPIDPVVPNATPDPLSGGVMTNQSVKIWFFKFFCVSLAAFILLIVYLAIAHGSQDSLFGKFFQILSLLFK